MALLEMQDLKTFFTTKRGVVKAVNGVSYKVEAGKTLGVVGESGSGKSVSAMSMLQLLDGNGYIAGGSIMFDGRDLTKLSLSEMQKIRGNAISVIFQEPMTSLNPVFTIERQVSEPFIIHQGMSKEEARKKVVEMLADVKIPNPEVVAKQYPHQLSGGMRQRVMIAMALACKPKLLIADEPTTALDVTIQAQILKLMNDLKREHGTSILFITHKLDEIKAGADRCTVLRKGKYVGTVDVATTSKEELSEMMVGRKVQLVMEKTPLKPGESVLTVQNLTVRSKKHGKPVVNNVSFNVHRGEIVCIAGIDGNGQSELVYALTGLMKPESGKIFLNNKDITHMSIRKRNEAGLSHIPEDRHKHGLVLDYSLENNLVLKRYFHPEFERNGFLQFGEIRKYADELIDRFDVRSGQGAVTKARSMSGGNQQKAIIAREVDLSSDLLIAVQPTRGLDVGAIEYIRKELLAQRDAGKAVLLVSLELDEVLEVPDRILVMYEGAIVGELDPRYTTAKELGLYMAGAQRNV